MKLFPFYIFLLLSITSTAQVPVIRTNVTLEEKENSPIYNNLNGKYDFVLSFTSQSYWWSNKWKYEILAYKNSNWEKLTYQFRKSKKGHLRKPIVQKDKFNRGIADELLQDLDKISFWTLNRDSLNIQTQVSKDSLTTKKYSITDGTNYKFEVFTASDFRIIESYEPEYYLEKIPEITIRKNFIKGINYFFGAFKK